MVRNLSSAKKAGALFEKQVANYLAQTLDDDRIERRTKNGTKDRGDITGLRINTHRAVVECKNHARLNLAGWIKEAALEAGNDDAPYFFIVHKRHGKQNPADAYVTMSLEMLTKILAR